ncbi:MAG: putative 2-aminoethylphosphonate ABC transporter permease subunit [Coriobacteriia bacterium]|nr:putative 2-aminoethylphosphonate ABC transporter permease subunit [Coriobacteriia bacterium]
MGDQIKRWLSGFHLWQFIALLVLIALFTVLMIFPLVSLFSKAFTDKSGTFVGLENYLTYFNNPTLTASILNTIDIALWSTLFAVTFGFLYAYALARTRIRGKTFFRYCAMIPIFIPTVIHALGLVYLFGKQGIFTRAGLFPFELYGRLGIILSEIIFTFPQAFLMFFIALEFADGRLYEAAESMGVSAFKKLKNITLPEIRFTLINAVFVCFTLAFTDFGAPKVIGGSFNVLATDIYKQVAGQFNFNMGAVVGTLLLIPAVLSFIADRALGNQNAGTINAKATRLNIEKSTVRDTFFFVFCVAITLFFFVLIASLFVGGLSENYPYNLAFTLKNFSFSRSAGGMDSYFNSLKMAVLTTAIGTIFVFIYAYLIEKTSGSELLRKYGKLLSVLPLALPGMVIGISYIFFFNNPSNPLNFMYGTLMILVVSNIVHYFSVPFLTATGTLKKLDKEFESVSDSMNVPRWKTFMRVSVPLSLPAILEICLYFFVNAMVTVSAVAFLYSAQFKIAAIAITHMEEAGNFGQAAAMSLLILGINVLVRILYETAIRIIKHKTSEREEVLV